MRQRTRSLIRRTLIVIITAIFVVPARLRAYINEPPQRAGFPFVINGGGTPDGHPAVADLKWPAPYSQYKSIVFTSWNAGTSQAWLYVVRYNGTAPSVAPGFPVPMPTRCAGSPAVGDLDGDGVPEIVVPYGSNYRDPRIGGVRAFRRDGTQIWDYSSSNNPPSQDGANFDYGVVGAPAIADLDGDGVIEVVWGSLDGKVYVVDGRNGNNKAGWPIFVRDDIWSSPVLFDLDGDGQMEIIIGVDAHHEDAPYYTPDGGVLHVFRHNGTGSGLAGQINVPELSGFPINYDQVLFSAPAVGDIDGDGKPEIVFGTGTFYGNPPPCGGGGTPRARRVYAVKCDGSPVPGWPATTGGEVKTAPALADLDGDGLPDVVITDIDCSSGTAANAYYVYAFKGNGTRLFKTLLKSYFGLSLSAGDPVVADVLGDPKPEVLVPSSTEVSILSNTGAQLTYDGSNGYNPPPGALSFYNETPLSNATVTSLKVSPQASDSVEVTSISAADFPTASNAEISIWNPAGKTNPLPAPTWGMFRQNTARTAFVPATASCTVMPPPATGFYTLPPCRVFDTRNSLGPLGGPILPSATRLFNLAAVCGIPADAKSVSINVTVPSPPSTGFLVLYPGGTGLPSSSTINFAAGQTRANNTVVRLSADGKGSLAVTNGSVSSTNVVVDVNGCFK
jgi:hypothetical protein